MQDLAVLTTETGVEYTELTIGNTSYLIRGKEKSTTIPLELKNILLEKKGTIDYHSHPFVGDLIPSKEDIEMLNLLTWQKESVIIDPTNNAIKYSKEGILGSIHINNEIDKSFWEDITSD